jgi:hypothetical protein
VPATERAWWLHQQRSAVGNVDEFPASQALFVPAASLGFQPLPAMSTHAAQQPFRHLSSMGRRAHGFKRTLVTGKGR